MPRPRSVDVYVASAPHEARPTLEALRALITSSVPDAEERISYGVPFYKSHGALAGFPAYKAHVSFGLGGDPLTNEDRAKLEKKRYATGKKTFQIRFDQKVPAADIKRMLQAAVRRRS